MKEITFTDLGHAHTTNAHTEMSQAIESCWLPVLPHQYWVVWSTLPALWLFCGYTSISSADFFEHQEVQPQY